MGKILETPTSEFARDFLSRTLSEFEEDTWEPDGCDEERLVFCRVSEEMRILLGDVLSENAHSLAFFTPVQAQKLRDHLHAKRYEMMGLSLDRLNVEVESLFDDLNELLQRRQLH